MDIPFLIFLNGYTEQAKWRILSSRIKLVDTKADWGLTVIWLGFENRAEKTAVNCGLAGTQNSFSGTQEQYCGDTETG